MPAGITSIYPIVHLIEVLATKAMPCNSGYYPTDSTLPTPLDVPAMTYCG